MLGFEHHSGWADKVHCCPAPGTRLLRVTTIWVFAESVVAKLRVVGTAWTKEVPPHPERAKTERAEAAIAADVRQRG